jgi:hypothetical protein
MISYKNHYLALGFALICSPLSNAADTTNIRADIWADNWFALYDGEKLIKEDSVAYNTERSFNSDSFSFDVTLPAQLSVIIKDYKEDDTGLEYIGTRRQQMGDGGFTAQFFNEDNQLIGVSNSEWHCLTIHRAPLDKACDRSENPQSECQAEIDAEPANWKNANYNYSVWPNAIEHSSQAVRPHGGYRDVSWQDNAKLIWAEDLEQDNTLLCRFTLTKDTIN